MLRQKNDKLELYREACKKYNSNSSDKDFIINFFIEDSKNNHCYSLCSIGFDNPLAMNLILSNNECVESMELNDAMRTFYCSDYRSQTRLLIMKIAITKNKRVLDKNPEFIQYLFNRVNDVDFLKILVDLKYITTESLFNSLSDEDIIKSEKKCFDFVTENININQKKQNEFFDYFGGGILHFERYVQNFIKLIKLFKFPNGVDISLLYLILLAKCDVKYKIVILNNLLSLHEIKYENKNELDLLTDQLKKYDIKFHKNNIEKCDICDCIQKCKIYY